MSGSSGSRIIRSMRDDLDLIMLSNFSCLPVLGSGPERTVAFRKFTYRPLVSYTLGLVPLECDLLLIFYDSSSFNTHFSLFFVFAMSLTYRRPSFRTSLSTWTLRPQQRLNGSDRSGEFDRLPHPVEHLRPRWKALTKPWRSTFGTLFTRRSNQFHE